LKNKVFKGEGFLRFLFHLTAGGVLLITGAVTILAICFRLVGVRVTITQCKTQERKVG